MRDVHPFLVLSPKAFNERTSLVSYNADNPSAITVGGAGRRSVLAANGAGPSQAGALFCCGRGLVREWICLGRRFAAKAPPTGAAVLLWEWPGGVPF